MKEVRNSSSGTDDRNTSSSDVLSSSRLRKSASSSRLYELRMSHHFDSERLFEKVNPTVLGSGQEENDKPSKPESNLKRPAESSEPEENQSKRARFADSETNTFQTASDQNQRKSRDQLASTNEASSLGSDSKASISESDWKSMRWQGTNDKLLLLADRCMQCKQYELGRKTYGYIIHNFEYTPSLNDNTIPRALDGLAKVYQNRGNPIDAKALCEASISYLAHTPETKDIDFAPAMKGLGKAWLELGNHPMAIEVYKSVLSICKETYGKDHPRTAGALKDLAKVYQTQERYEKAKAAYEYVYSIYEKNFGKDHSRTKKVQQNLRDLPQKAGKVDKSESIKKLMDKEVPDILLNFVKHHRRFPKLYGPELPQTDLVLWRHLFDKRPLVRTVTDRLKVREYVKGKIGEKYLPEILHETDDPSTIRFETLPDKFVIKSTQGSGRVIVVDGKSKMDKEMIIKECESWLDPANDYYKKTGSKVYKGNTQRIVIEGFIDNGSGSSPDDNKFFTYNGVARYLQVDKGRQGEHTIDLIDMQNGEKIPLKHDWIQSSSGDVPPPPHSKEMQELSQVLGKELGFGRIDWYPTEAQPIWGEITPAPGGGTWDFVPAMSNRIVSETWEAHSKTWRKLPGPSEEVYDLISQISRGLHKLVEEGQGHTHTKGLIMREKA